LTAPTPSARDAPHPMSRHLAYRLLAAVTACWFFLFGFVFLCGFIDRTLFQVLAHPLFDTDPWGYYILGVAGSGLIVWAIALFASVRAPTLHPGVATATTVGLILGAIVRLLAWYSGEFRHAGDQLRLEAGLFLVLALGFIWLRPPRLQPPLP
jgi:formate-dependent nitrite reductase membrane component NrfD